MEKLVELFPRVPKNDLLQYLIAANGYTADAIPLIRASGLVVPTFEEIRDGVSKMIYTRETVDKLKQYGLVALTVSWEDTARKPNSAWGPNISDMTLVCDKGDVALPVIRHPNFSDLTWDHPIEKVPLSVGNQVRDSGNQVLHPLLLADYLRNIGDYLTVPVCGMASLLADRDTHVLMSAQSCVLPVAPASTVKKTCSECVGRGECTHTVPETINPGTDFHVRLFNYQSRPDAPAVLVIVATDKGTSAQVVDGRQTDVYFNLGGKAAPFVGQRLLDYRASIGDTNKSKDMSLGEAMQNTVMVIQVPLVIPAPAGPCAVASGGSWGYQPPQTSSFTFGAGPCATASGGPALSWTRSKGDSAPRAADMEHAIVKVGAGKGEFRELGVVTADKIKRDTRFPIRVTLQFYKASSSPLLSDEHVFEIAKQLMDAKTSADRIGSLVTTIGSDRITAPDIHMAPAPAPFVPSVFGVPSPTFNQ